MLHKEDVGKISLRESQYISIVIDSPRNIRMNSTKSGLYITYYWKGDYIIGNLAIMFDDMGELKRFLDRHMEEYERLSTKIESLRKKQKTK